jgi:hypothetical protein
MIGRQLSRAFAHTVAYNPVGDRVEVGAPRSRAKAADSEMSDRARSVRASCEDEWRSLCPRAARAITASQRVSGAGASDSRCHHLHPSAVRRSEQAISEQPQPMARCEHPPRFLSASDCR